MSVKIWEAYRIRKGYDHWDVLQKIRSKCVLNIKQTLRETYANFLEHWTACPRDYALLYKETYGYEAEPDKKPTSLFARDYTQRNFAKQAGSSSKDMFDLDVSVVVRRVKGRYLLIPYPGSGFFSRSLKFMKNMKELEDYHYQNQSDAPFEYNPKSKVTRRMWRERKKTWTSILDEPKWSEMLVIEICSPGGFTKIDPWFDDLVKRSKEAEKRAKTTNK